ncbi:MAG: cysteine desulfurase family protein [Trueperaceae bacterium]
MGTANARRASASTSIAGAVLDLDRAATTPLLPEVREAMLPWLGAAGANASAVHGGGRAARRALEDARERVAAAVGAAPSEVVFTSGATEADQLALVGVAAARPGGHLVVGRGEHPAVVRAAEQLAARGHPVTWLAPGADGRVAPAAVRDALRDDTLLVVAMHVNNETGARNDVAGIAGVVRAFSHDARAVREQGARGALEGGPYVLCDAVQSLGLERLRRDELGADLWVLSAHKAGGPQGIGALVLRAGVELVPQAWGGSQERGRRAGTSPVALAVGFGVAAELADAEAELRGARVAAVRDRFEAAVLALPGVEPSLPPGTPRSPKHAHVVVPDLRGDGETLLMNLDAEGVWASLGSACAAGSLEPSPVLLAMGWTPRRARSAVRFSFGDDHTEADADEAARRFARALERALS